MPLVVMEAEMSISAAPSEVGKPAAIGLGVNTPRVPLKGATLAVCGSGLAITSSMPSSAARRR